MKNSLNILANPLSNSQMENLTKVINETIAFDLIEVNRHVFTSADLWNIQRNLKPRNERRYF